MFLFHILVVEDPRSLLFQQYYFFFYASHYPEVSCNVRSIRVKGRGGGEFYGAPAEPLASSGYGGPNIKGKVGSAVQERL